MERTRSSSLTVHGHALPHPRGHRDPGQRLLSGHHDVPLLSGAGLTLDDATLDRIDEIVAPGTDVHPPDGAWENPALADVTRRRRPRATRAARD